MMEMVIFISVVLGMVGGFAFERVRQRVEPAQAVAVAPRAAAAGAAAPGTAVAKPQAFDSVARLRIVSDTNFSLRRLLTEREAERLAEVEGILADLGVDWRVMPQVSLSDILAAEDETAWRALGGQRVAMVILAANQMSIAAVDYQPMGQVREEDAVLDAVRREALRRSGIEYIELRANDGSDMLRGTLTELAGMYDKG
jgi:hypothetical protein